jgi:hypothetical protein
MEVVGLMAKIFFFFAKKNLIIDVLLAYMKILFAVEKDSTYINIGNCMYRSWVCVQTMT